MDRISGVSILLVYLLLTSCANDAPREEKHGEPLLFELLPSASSGLDFRNELRESDSLNILDYLYFYNGGGVAIGDINNDGLQDVFFTSNQGSNQLYLNKGNFKFDNITAVAGIAGKADWNTGVTMADVNADGFLDIYVVAVNGISGSRGKNELFINNGDGTFTEKAAEYGIDLENYGTTAAFFDYDNDGDLDLFVLNHAVHTEESFGPAEVRNRRSPSSGDKLFRNNGTKFEDVSEEAGIFGGPNGYGLGLATADFNNDGLTDIYVSNDFHEDDYLYMNNGDGTFSEKLKDQIQQVSRFSMGSDVADINHDGYPDILTLDMLPQDEKVLKSSMGDEDINVLNLRERFGYHKQFSRNMLQLNMKGEGFQEIALAAGVAATDWSWSALFGDYNLDGEVDLFISNGIVQRPNDLDYIKYISNSQIRNKNKAGGIEREALALMPSGKVSNYFFEGSENLKFIDRSGQWAENAPGFSNGSAYGDLDNDGDLDLVVNNLNDHAQVYRNTAAHGNNYIKIKFELPGQNRKGLGTKVYAWADGKLQYQQLFTGRGFQSSSEDLVHFGFGRTIVIDSLKIVWPDRRSEKMYEVKVNQTLTLSPSENAVEDSLFLARDKQQMFTKTSLPGLEYTHRENPYNDFDRQKLIPYRISDSGPAVAVGDLNGDGKDDLFIGSSRGYKAEIFFQKEEGFEAADLPFLEETKNVEITGVIVADLDQNGWNDIFYVTGGGEFNGKSTALHDGYWSYNGREWEKQQLPDYFSSAGVIKAADYDADGDIDIFIGSRAVAGDFGKIPESFLLENRGGSFKLVNNQELSHPGMITDALWEDMDQDGYPELLLVGEWMAPKIFKNRNGNLKEETPGELGELKGLWRTIEAFDIDGDGEQDYLLGNWGQNSKFKASREYPLYMYYGDIDNNGSTETIVAQEYDGAYYPIAGLDELASQMNFLRKEFPFYSKFSGKNLDEIFSADKLRRMESMQVNVLSSGYLKSEKGSFKFVSFEENLQFAPINATLVGRDGYSSKEFVILAGNYFGVIPYHGGFGAFSGAMLVSEGKIAMGQDLGLNLSKVAVRALKFLSMGEKKYLLVFSNSKPVGVYTINLAHEDFK